MLAPDKARSESHGDLRKAGESGRKWPPYAVLIVKITEFSHEWEARLSVSTT